MDQDDGEQGLNDDQSSYSEISDKEEGDEKTKVDAVVKQ